MTTKRIRLLLAFAALLPLAGAAGAQSLPPLGLQPLGCLIEPNRVVGLGSPVIGVVESIEVERGDRVRKGQVIATLRAAPVGAKPSASAAASRREAERLDARPRRGVCAEWWAGPSCPGAPSGGITPGR